MYHAVYTSWKYAKAWQTAGVKHPYEPAPDPHAPIG
jgi:hypothetical protein